MNKLAWMHTHIHTHTHNRSETDLELVQHIIDLFIVELFMETVEGTHMHHVVIVSIVAPKNQGVLQGGCCGVNVSSWQGGYYHAITIGSSTMLPWWQVVFPVHIKCMYNTHHNCHAYLQSLHDIHTVYFLPCPFPALLQLSYYAVENGQFYKIWHPTISSKRTATLSNIGFL